MPDPSSASVDPRVGSSALPPGERIGGHYRVLDPLGRPGGFGRTYRALDETLHREVAIKEYFPRDLATRAPGDRRVVPHSAAERAAFEFGKVRFLDEGRTLARLDHAHVVRVLELFEDLGTAYLVMEYHRGANLAEVAAVAGGALPEPVVATLVADLLEGLAAVHAAGVFHCDVKPSNLYLSESGLPLLLDFGAARRDLGERTATLDGIVSPGFAPFELFQERGRIGPWTDVYGVAATAVALLTGERPPSAADRLDRDPLAIDGELARRLPAALRGPLVAALAVRGEARTPTASALLAAIRDAAGIAPAPREALAALAARAREAVDQATERETGSSTTTLRGAPASRSGAAARRRALRRSAVAGSAIAVLAALSWVGIRQLSRNGSDATPAQARPAPVVAAAPAAPGEVELAVFPFGELISLRSAAGVELVRGAAVALPARVRLPAGSWTATVRSPPTGESIEIPVTVTAAGVSRVEHRFRGLDPRAYFAETGW